MKIILLQTCDGSRYSRLLDVTESINRLYAAEHGYAYHRYDGILLGCQPWHATFNRIPLLRKLQPSTDWVLYLDADAYIHDTSRSIADFLRDRGHGGDRLLYACRGAQDDDPHTWDINAGVMLWNMRHPDAGRVLEMWEDRIRPKYLTETSQWKDQNDQTILHDLLRDLGPDARQRLLSVGIGEDGHNDMNYGGPFIRQLLNLHNGVMDARVAEAQKALTRTVLQKYRKQTEWIPTYTRYLDQLTGE